MRNVSATCCVLWAAWAVPLPAAPAGARQHTWTGVERIVAVGDVHGDHDQFVKVLRAAKVIDKDGNWIAGKTHLVQLGDVLDRGPHSRRAMDLLMKLQPQAAKAGGMVHPLIGNHEAMVLLGEWSYVHPGELEAFGGARQFRQAMGPTGKYGKWIRSHNAVIRINDLLFVHAGLVPPAGRMSLRKINEAIRKDLAKGDADGLATDPDGPLWDRSLPLGETSEVAGPLNAVLKRHRARRMIVAHTVCPDGVLVQHGGRLIRVDVGMCAYYGGPAACLVVEKGLFYEVRHPGKKRRLAIGTATTRPATAPASRPAARRPARRPSGPGAPAWSRAAAGGPRRAASVPGPRRPAGVSGKEHLAEIGALW